MYIYYVYIEINLYCSTNISCLPCMSDECILIVIVLLKKLTVKVIGGENEKFIFRPVETVLVNYSYRSLVLTVTRRPSRNYIVLLYGNNGGGVTDNIGV